MADKTNDLNDTTGTSPVYDSLVDGGEPVVATVDSEPETVTQYDEPEEIVVDDAGEYDPTAAHQTAVIDPVTEEPAAAPREPEPAYQQPQVVYRDNPTAPARKGNRGFGVLIAILATIVFALIFIVVIALINAARTGTFSFGFIGHTETFLPVIFFLVGTIVLALLLNRAPWWTWVLGSLVLAVFVYFGTAGALLLTTDVISKTPTEASKLFEIALTNPFTIAAALVAREVAVWSGTIIGRRGRKVKARNVEAQETFERDNANRGY